MGQNSSSQETKMTDIDPFQPSVAFQIETSHLFRSANQMTGVHMKCNTGLKWVKVEFIYLNEISLFKYKTLKLFQAEITRKMAKAVRSTSSCYQTHLYDRKIARESENGYFVAFLKEKSKMSKKRKMCQKNYVKINTKNSFNMERKLGNRTTLPRGGGGVTFFHTN